MLRVINDRDLKRIKPQTNDRPILKLRSPYACKESPPFLCRLSAGYIGILLGSGIQRDYLKRRNIGKNSPLLLYAKRVNTHSSLWTL